MYIYINIYIYTHIQSLSIQSGRASAGFFGVRVTKTALGLGGYPISGGGNGGVTFMT